MHSTASDGSDPPEALPRLAKQARLAAIALTDHDTTAGLPACAAACAELDIAFAPGIEVSADPFAVLREREGDAGAHRYGTLHVLGLFVRHDDPMLAEIHRRMSAARNERNPAIVGKLRDLGMKIDYAEVEELALTLGTQVIGRPHIAQVLIRKGYVKSTQDAFKRYIGQGAPAYVRRDRLDPRHAIEAIHHAGGLAVIAHPVQLKCADDEHLEHYLAQLKKLGLDAVETRHSDHPPELVARYESIAASLGLLTSGGSDYHGSRKGIALGSQRVLMETFERLRQRAAAPLGV